MRPIYKIIISLIIILAFAGPVYFFFFRGGADTAEEQNMAAERLALVLNEPVFSPALSYDGGTIRFFDSAGKLFNLPLEEGAQKKEFPIPDIAGFREALWQPGGSSFIVRQNIEGHARYQFYDAEFRNLVDYPANLAKPKFVFGDSIVYEWSGEDGGRTLKVSNFISTEFRSVAELFRPDYRIAASPAKNEAVLYSENQFAPSKMFLVNLDTGSFRDLSVPLSVQGASFSPDGKYLLVARWGEQNQSLPAFYLQNLETLDIFVPDMFGNIEQAVWSEDGRELYIADGRGIKKLDIASNQILALYEFGEGEDFEPADLLLHPSRESLFFIDKKTGYLYRIRL